MNDFHYQYACMICYFSLPLTLNGGQRRGRRRRVSRGKGIRKASACSGNSSFDPVFCPFLPTPPEFADCLRGRVFARNAALSVRQRLSFLAYFSPVTMSLQDNKVQGWAELFLSVRINSMEITHPSGDNPHVLWPNARPIASPPAPFALVQQ